MGRLVITHSTYVEGLIPLLKRLAEEVGIETVTPAVICRVRGRCVGLRLRISTPITGGFKLLARRERRPRRSSWSPAGSARSSRSTWIAC